MLLIFNLIGEYISKVKIWNKMLTNNRINQEIKDVFFDYKEKAMFKYYLKSVASKDKELSENILNEIAKDSQAKKRLIKSIILYFSRIKIGRSFLSNSILIYWKTHKLWRKLIDG